jgi:hypothetical protein
VKSLAARELVQEGRRRLTTGRRTRARPAGLGPLRRVDPLEADDLAAQLDRVAIDHPHPAVAEDDRLCGASPGRQQADEEHNGESSSKPEHPPMLIEWPLKSQVSRTEKRLFLLTVKHH